MTLGQAENHESEVIVRNLAKSCYELESYLNSGLTDIKSAVLYGHKIQKEKKVES